MSKTSVIIHPVRAYFIVVRSDYLLLCQDAPDMHCAALLLDRFEQWTNSKLDNELGTWIYMSLDDMVGELYHQYGRNKINKCLVWLCEMGWLNKRKNPNNDWDKTLQYELNSREINSSLSIAWDEAIDSLELTYREGETNPSDSLELTYREGETNLAIPQTPTKIHSKIHSKTPTTTPGPPEPEPIIQELDTAFGHCCRCYESEIGLLTIQIKDCISDALKDFPESWIIDAIKLATENNVRKWSYVYGVLKNWKRDGRAGLKKAVGAENLTLDEQVQHNANDYTGGKYAAFIES